MRDALRCLWRWLTGRPTAAVDIRHPETGGLASNIRVGAWDADVLATAVGAPPTEAGPAADAWWAVLDSVVGRADGPRPADVWSEHNITCEAVHEHLADCLNPTTPSDPEASRVDFAIGNSASVTTSVSDTSLDNEQGRYPVTQYTTTGRQISLRGVLSTEQGNGVDITEMGIFGPQGLWNHAAFSTSIEKDSAIALTIDVLLTVMDESEVA